MVFLWFVTSVIIVDLRKRCLATAKSRLLRHGERLSGLVHPSIRSAGYVLVFKHPKNPRRYAILCHRMQVFQNGGTPKKNLRLRHFSIETYGFQWFSGSTIFRNQKRVTSWTQWTSQSMLGWRYSGGDLVNPKKSQDLPWTYTGWWWFQPLWKTWVRQHWDYIVPNIMHLNN